MKNAKQKLGAFVPFIGLVAVALAFILITKGRFVSSNNLNTLLSQSYTVMLVALGATLIYAHGGMDFSVGSVLAISEMCAAMLYRATGSIHVLIPTAIAVSVGCGFITGLATVKLNMPPFISSLCMQFACRGILNVIVNTQAIGVTELATPTWGMRLPVLGVVIVAMALLLGYTKIGKYNKAIGENIRAARTSGINVDRYRIYAYLISGVTLGLAAYFDLLRSGSISSNVGYGLEMEVIIALVLGGLSLSGGYSASVRCAIIGSLIIVMITNGLVMVGLQPSYIGLIEGIVFLGVVLVTYKRDKTGLLPR